MNKKSQPRYFYVGLDGTKVPYPTKRSKIIKLFNRTYLFGTFDNKRFVLIVKS